MKKTVSTLSAMASLTGVACFVFLGARPQGIALALLGVALWLWTRRLPE